MRHFALRQRPSSRPANRSVANHFANAFYTRTQGAVMDKELFDRAEAIRRRIVQLRDSL
jgi:hypothetical protein